MADETTTIVCNRVSDGPSFVEGATITHCHQCGNDVWLSPSSASAISRMITEGTPTKIMCVPCVGSVEETVKEWYESGMPVMPEQRSELREGIRRQEKGER